MMPIHRHNEHHRERPVSRRGGGGVCGPGRAHRTVTPVPRSQLSYPELPGRLQETLKRSEGRSGGACSPLRLSGR